MQQSSESATTGPAEARPRRTHKQRFNRSRLGCLTCRGRKIKCDQVGTCSNLSECTADTPDTPILRAMRRDPSRCESSWIAVSKCTYLFSAYGRLSLPSRRHILVIELENRRVAQHRLPLRRPLRPMRSRWSPQIWVSTQSSLEWMG